MILISEQQLPSIIKRLSHQILETHPGLDNTVIIGLQPRGVFLSDRIVAALHQELPADQVVYGKLDITFYRDDIRRELHVATQTDLPFSIEGKTVILIDDVLIHWPNHSGCFRRLNGFWTPFQSKIMRLSRP